MERSLHLKWYDGTFTINSLRINGTTMVGNVFTESKFREVASKILFSFMDDIYVFSLSKSRKMVSCHVRRSSEKLGAEEGNVRKRIFYISFSELRDIKLITLNDTSFRGDYEDFVWLKNMFIGMFRDVDGYVVDEAPAHATVVKRGEYYDRWMFGELDLYKLVLFKMADLKGKGDKCLLAGFKCRNGAVIVDVTHDFLYVVLDSGRILRLSVEDYEPVVRHVRSIKWNVKTVFILAKFYGLAFSGLVKQSLKYLMRTIPGEWIDLLGLDAVPVRYLGEHI